MTYTKLTRFLIGFLFLSSLVRAEEVKDTDTNFDNLKALTAAIAKADKVVLYEGLPHQTWEKDLLDVELKTKKTVKLNGVAFYEEQLSLKEEDAKKLTALFCDPSSFSKFAGYKRCGGYHPDYCIEWQVGKESYRAQFCFGCGEMKCFGPKTEVYCDMKTEAAKKFKEILETYRKNRPRAEKK